MSLEYEGCRSRDALTIDPRSCDECGAYLTDEEYNHQKGLCKDCIDNIN
jgi:hypothetical protein